MSTKEEMSKTCREIRAELGINYIDPGEVHKVEKREFVLSHYFPVAKMKKLLASDSSMLEFFRSFDANDTRVDIRLENPVLMREKETADSDWEYFGWLSCYDEGCGFFAPYELRPSEISLYEKDAFEVDEKTAVKLSIQWAQVEEEFENDFAMTNACGET